MTNLVPPSTPPVKPGAKTSEFAALVVLLVTLGLRLWTGEDHSAAVEAIVVGGMAAAVSAYTLGRSMVKRPTVTVIDAEPPVRDVDAPASPF